jgi:putative transposase
MYYGRSIGHDITTLDNRYITRRAQVKTNIEDGNLVYLSQGQAAKSGLNKSMLDAARGQFTTVIKYVAGKLGKSAVFVDPKGSSQHWWNCLKKVPKELSD